MAPLGIKPANLVVLVPCYNRDNLRVNLLVLITVRPFMCGRAASMPKKKFKKIIKKWKAKV